MFFEIRETAQEIAFEQINPDAITLGLITAAELPALAEQLGFAVFTVEESAARHSHRSGDLYVYDQYSFGVLNMINAHDMLCTKDRVGFYICKNMLLAVVCVDEDESIQQMFKDLVLHLNCNGLTLEKAVCAFLERTVYQNREDIEEIERSIEKMEISISAGRVHRATNPYLITTHRRLLLMRDYYEQLLDVLDQLRGNSNDLFDDKQLRYFKILSDRVARMSANTQLVRDYLVQVRDSYRASLDYNLNRFVRISTIMTTLCLPLTLITGWYGMNFAKMPELTWQHGYPAVICLAITVIALCLWLFKKQKFL